MIFILKSKTQNSTSPKIKGEKYLPSKHNKIFDMPKESAQKAELKNFDDFKGQDFITLYATEEYDGRQRILVKPNENKKARTSSGDSNNDESLELAINSKLNNRVISLNKQVENKATITTKKVSMRNETHEVPEGQNNISVNNVKVEDDPTKVLVHIHRPAADNCIKRSSHSTHRSSKSRKNCNSLHANSPTSRNSLFQQKASHLSKGISSNDYRNSNKSDCFEF